MSIRDFLRELIVEIVAFFISAVFVIVTAVLYNPWLALAQGILLITFAMLEIVKFFSARSRERHIQQMVSNSLDLSDEGNVNAFPLPVLVCNEDGVIEMFNSKFRHTFMDDAVLDRKLAQPFLGGCMPAEVASDDGTTVKINDSYYSIYSYTVDFKGHTEYVFCYTDVSEMRKTQLAYIKSRPVIILMQTDDISDIKAGYRDSERAEIRGGIEAAVENWAGKYSCIMRRISEDRFMVIAQNDVLDEMRRDRFSVLDDIRNYKYKDKTLGITISIGAGTGNSIIDCETAAEKSLEMALGRGGDQAAVKTKDEYEFFGGVSKSIEKTTKFQTRVAASSLSSLITGSDNVIIMGHSFPDMDAFGAAVGIYAIARSLGVRCAIALDREKNFVGSVMEMLAEDNWDGIVVSQEEALAAMTKKTLLIVVDTHRSSFVNFPDVYEKASAVVVIDHHRKSVDHIENALIFFHDPNASSTCEIVTELMRYISPMPELSAAEAQAMLAGIMLDTKEFVLGTGVRTFEAAAFLKSKGADTVRVKRLFSNSIDSSKRRNEIISRAKLYRGCAVSYAGADMQDARLISSQAADELLEVEGVKASFVIFDCGDGGVNISARSYGDINVQIIMEVLGGGGHRTMAAAQLKDVTVEQAAGMLRQAIDEKYPK